MSAAGTTEIVETKKERAIAKRPIDTFRDLLDKLRPQLQMALPKHVDINRMIRICVTTLQRNPDLLRCTQESVLGCLFQCAQLGLEPDGLLGHAYLIPFNDRKNDRTICTLIVGYKGLLKLARQSNEIASVSARVVHEKDVFEYEFGLEDKLRHVPALDDDPGELTYAYAIFRYKGGGYHFDVMSRAEIEAIKKRSRSGNNGPWVTDFAEMAKKTVLRRASKMAPASIEDLARAIALDSQGESGSAPALEIDMPAPSVPGSAPEEQGRRISLKRKPGGPEAVSEPQDEETGEVTVAPTPEALKELDELIFATKADAEALAKGYGVDEIARLSAAQVTDAIDKLRALDGQPPAKK